jgi:N-acetylmuramoyl-L-alanine amidase
MSQPTIRRASPNFDRRRLPVTMVVLHYTGMVDAEAAILRLCDPAAKVSSHYLITEAGEVVALVDEALRAWHAGAAFWRGISDVNSASVGIELANPGHDFGYQPFPMPQMVALLALLPQIVARHGIAVANVVGHSDVAPTRKIDPGELFDWERLAHHRLAVPRPRGELADPAWDDAGVCAALASYGYGVEEPAATIRAFQRRFRPEAVTGVADAETRAILNRLLLDERRQTAT